MIHFKKLRFLLAVAGLTVALPLVAHAQTLAQWRFEDPDGDVGEKLYAPNYGANNEGGITTSDPLTNGTVPVADSSGNGNVLRTFHTGGDFDTSPTFSGNVPFGTIAQTGEANTKSLLFDGNDDIYTQGIDNSGDPINGETFGSGFTIEMSFQLSTTTNYDTLIGRDNYQIPGSGDQNISSLYFQTIGSNEGAAQQGSLAIKVVDVNGVASNVYSLVPLTAGVWYNAVAVSSGGTMSLYLAQTGQPLDASALQGTAVQSGSIYSNGGNWSVGRGFYNNSVTDWIEGSLDEIRITRGGLAPSSFLGNAATVIPESGTAVLSLLGLTSIGLGILRRRT